VIRSFQHAGLEKFFTTGSKAGIQPAHAKKLRRQLFALDGAEDPAEMWRDGICTRSRETSSDIGPSASAATGE
jgi:plasmid maintenance system killer protein